MQNSGGTKEKKKGYIAATFLIYIVILLIGMFLLGCSLGPGPVSTTGRWILGLWFIVAFFIALGLVHLDATRESRAEPKALKEFNPSLVPPIEKAFKGVVQGWFDYGGVNKDGEYFSCSSLAVAESATITFKGDHVAVEAIISTRAPIKSHTSDYIIFSETKTTVLSYDGVGTLHIDQENINLPFRHGRTITIRSTTSFFTGYCKITCNTEEDAISLWNGFMDIYIKRR